VKLIAGRKTASTHSSPSSRQREKHLTLSHLFNTTSNYVKHGKLIQHIFDEAFTKKQKQDFFKLQNGLVKNFCIELYNKLFPFISPIPKYVSVYLKFSLFSLKSWSHM